MKQHNNNARATHQPSRAAMIGHTPSHGRLGLRATGMGLALLAITACDERAGPTDRTLAPAAIVQSSSAAPGTRPLRAFDAVNQFRRVCVAALPDFKTMPARLGKGFVQHSVTGTYFSRQYDLSFKLIENDCSMVFAVRGDAGPVIAQLRATHPSVRAAGPRTGGLYNARIAKQQ